jgi:ribosomal protein S1
LSKQLISKEASSKPATTMAELLAKSNTSVVGFTRGQKVQAKVIEINKKSASFDVGGKSEGVLIDTYFLEARDFISEFKPGDMVQATVIDPETSDGSVLLSLRHAASDKFWENLDEAKEKNLPVYVLVRSVNTKGVTVELDALITFIPQSLLGKKTAANLEDLIGKRIKVRILEVDRERKRVLLSEKAVSEEKELEEEALALQTLEENQIYDGIVKEVTSFGAFVEISSKNNTKVEGLVHVSEVSWQKVKETAEVLEEGQSVKVKVLGLRDGKLALSIKQAEADPWSKVAEKYKPDTKLKGTVVRSSNFGTFVELEPGIEGLVHITKIPPATKFTPGEGIDVYVEEVDVENKKISLGLILTSKPVGYR